MVELCFRIADGGSMTLEDVKADLALGKQTPRAPRPLLGAAAYYDAACAVSMLAGRLPGGSTRRKEHFDYAFTLLETAVAATPEARRLRVREMAMGDDMLEPLRDCDEARFSKIVGDEPKTEPAPEEGDSPTFAEALAQFIATLGGPSP